LKLRILSLNTGLFRFRFIGLPGFHAVPFAKERLPHITDGIVRCNADLVFLQEVNSEKYANIIRACAQYQYSHLHVKSGLMVLSKFPLEAENFISYQEKFMRNYLGYRNGILSAKINVPGAGILRICNVHLIASLWPYKQDSLKSASVRKSQISLINEYVSYGERTPCILAGDFNCGPQIDQQNFSFIKGCGFEDSFELAACQNEDKSGITWDSNIDLNRSGVYKKSPSQRIDHIFFSRELLKKVKVTHSSIVMKDPVFQNRSLNVHASDHYGLMTDITLE
jgi:endonuclease/exonuclease/phosphatase family metal-dependent hydrolase